MNRKRNAWRAIAALVTSCLASATLADHSWETYHWARTTGSFDLTVINSTTSEWNGYVSQAASSWSASSVLNLVEDSSGDTANKTRRQCRGGEGTVRICNLSYGNTGWLGIAGISIDPEAHITTGYTKLNDTYFSTSYYDNFAWRQSVACQELGHNVGLDHQDEDFDNGSLFSCMDYQDPPYEYPNGHDYDELQAIYDHLDSYDSYATGDGDGGDGGGCNAPPGKGCNKSGFAGNPGWGASLGRRGNSEKFMRIDPDGTVHLTYVIWAVGY